MQFDTLIVGQVRNQLRTQKDMTQEILSGFVGVARTHLPMIKNGSKQPNFETVLRIKDLFAAFITPKTSFELVGNDLSLFDFLLDSRHDKPPFGGRRRREVNISVDLFVDPLVFEAVWKNEKALKT